MPEYPVLAGAKDPRPNVIFVLTDDQERTSLDHMPSLQTGPWRVFPNAVVTSPLCGIARATLQTGMYSHNHRVWTNLGATGGYERMRALGLDGDTAATRLKAAGYQTCHIGKYQNGFDGRSVPPGWDRWFSKVQSKDFMAWGPGRDRWVPINGLPSGDTMTRKRVLDWLPSLSADSRPFFLQAGFYAPHGPADYQDRYAEMFSDLGVPRTPDYDEEDVSDKPSMVRYIDRLTDAERDEYDELYRRKLRAMQFVDDFLADLFARLAELGRLDNTYVFFYTDNAVHMGQHRLDYGKNAPYSTDTEFPLYVRGPGVEPGEDPRLVGNHDFVPTFADLGGADPVAGADGRSLSPLFGGGDVPWRDAVLSERPDPQTGVPLWSLLRTEAASYVERDTGETELYDLDADPHQLENLAGTRPDEEAELAARLDALKNCSGDSCRAAEDGAPAEATAPEQTAPEATAP